MNAGNDRDRPLAGPAPKMSSSDIPTVHLELVVNLDHDDAEVYLGDWGRADRFALEKLGRVPAGATVRIVVGERIYWSPDAVEMLRTAMRRGVVVIFMATSIEAGLRWRRAVVPAPVDEEAA